MTAAHCSESFHEVQIGRHNRSNTNEIYQSFIVETIKTHPRYFRNKFLDPDPHDFAIVKLFGGIGSDDDDDIQYVQINRNDNIPTPDQQLHVFGWGSVNPNDLREQSDVLLETEAYYIPNEECKKIVGSYRGTEINYDHIVIDATLCAMNFENMSDSCRGDSGGGLIVKGSTPQEDILVGIVSAGFGCAHPILPAIYARVSEVYDWIEEQVCQLSENPPDNFNCTSWTKNTLSQQQNPVPSDPFRCDEYPAGRETLNHPCSKVELLVNITIEINLDTRPEELGWILRTKDSSRQGGWVTRIERPIFTYRDSPPMSTIAETLTIPNNREYEIVLLDSYGDGLNPLSSSLSDVLRILDEEGNTILSVDEFTSQSNNGYYFSHEFIVGLLPTNAPSVSPAPTATPYINRITPIYFGCYYI